MSKTRKAVLNDALKRTGAGGHGKSRKAQRMADKAADRRALQDIGAWGMQR